MHISVCSESVSPRQLQKLREATASDCVLQKLIQFTIGGWPLQKSDADLMVDEPNEGNVGRW